MRVGRWPGAGTAQAWTLRATSASCRNIQGFFVAVNGESCNWDPTQPRGARRFLQRATSANFTALCLNRGQEAAANVKLAPCAALGLDTLLQKCYCKIALVKALLQTQFYNVIVAH